MCFMYSAHKLKSAGSRLSCYTRKVNSQTSQQRFMDKEKWPVNLNLYSRIPLQDELVQPMIEPGVFIASYSGSTISHPA